MSFRALSFYLRRTSGFARRSSALFISPSRPTRAFSKNALLCLLSDVIYGFGVVLGLAVLPSAPIVEVFLPQCPFCDASWSPRCWRQQLEDPNQFLPLFTFRI